jgi:hypothetical protein
LQVEIASVRNTFNTPNQLSTIVRLQRYWLWLCGWLGVAALCHCPTRVGSVVLHFTNPENAQNSKLEVEFLWFTHVSLLHHYKVELISQTIVNWGVCVFFYLVNLSGLF